MNVSVQIKPSPGLQQLLRGSSMVSGYAVMSRAGQAVTDYLRRYHAKMDWKGSGWISPSLGFADKVVKGWGSPVVSGSRITITNTFGLLKWKVTGGEIYPVKASMLAWPLISEAKGKTVAEFRATGEPLFQAGMALCRRVGKRVEAVYALSKGVKQFPWPDALPTNDALALVFTTAVNQEIARVLGTRMAA